jgi:fructosamine-3-kinase
LNSDLQTQLESTIAESLGKGARIVNQQSIGGGCINDARQLTLADGRSLFLKTNRAAPTDMFDAEARGLKLLAGSKALRVPQVIDTGTLDDGTDFLLLEMIEAGRRPRDFFETFGRQLAFLHQQSTDPCFGLDHNNYIGSTPQNNETSGDWCQFYRTHRLEYQIKLAVSKGLINRDVQRHAEKMLQRLPEFLQAFDEPPALIHGDLWSGNYMCDADGEPVLIDPAVYYGHREAEFGMTTLFGGFDESFYAAYQEVWPLAAGSEQRIELYRLYHLLNHLNLFGISYLGGCLAIINKYS